LFSQSLAWPLFCGDVNNYDQKLFGSNVQLPIFATRFTTKGFEGVGKRKVLYRKTLMVRILVVSLPSASKVQFRAYGYQACGRSGRQVLRKFWVFSQRGKGKESERKIWLN
jgi:hypothetical protein